MTREECIDKLNNIDWNKPNKDIFWDIILTTARCEDCVDTEPICKMYDLSGTIPYLYSVLSKEGLYGVLRCLEHIDRDNPASLFRLTKDGHLDEVSQPELRQAVQDIIKNLLEKDKKQTEPEEVWTEEDDDFLTEGVK